MNERACTVSEIDALRSAVKTRWMFGTTMLPKHAVSATYNATEMGIEVEQRVRTYMAAGITADDIYAEDRGITVAQLRADREARKQTMKSDPEWKESPPTKGL